MAAFDSVAFDAVAFDAGATGTSTVHISGRLAPSPLSSLEADIATPAPVTDLSVEGVLTLRSYPINTLTVSGVLSLRSVPIHSVRVSGEIQLHGAITSIEQGCLNASGVLRLINGEASLCGCNHG